MKAFWHAVDEQDVGNGAVKGSKGITAASMHGGPYVDEEDDGSTSITYYGRPGGRVQITLDDEELARLKEKLS